MRNQFFLAAGFLLHAGLAIAQQAPLGQGLQSGFGSGFRSNLESGLSSGFEARLGVETPRTLAEPFNPDRISGAGGCAPTQSDPDHTGCRPVEWLRGEGVNPNRVITFTGDSAFRSATARDPNRIETYSGLSGFAPAPAAAASSPTGSPLN